MEKEESVKSERLLAISVEPFKNKSTVNVQIQNKESDIAQSPIRASMQNQPKAHMLFFWIRGHHVRTDKHDCCCLRMILRPCNTTGKDGQNVLQFKWCAGFYMENYTYSEKCFLCYLNKLAVSWLCVAIHYVYLNVKHIAFSGKMAIKHEIKNTNPWNN